MSFSFDKVCSNIIPVGKYKAQVTDVKFRTNSLGETSKDLAITLTIVDGAYNKRVVIDNIVEKAFSFRLKPFLTACKVDMAKEFATAEELYNYGMKEAKDKIVLIDLKIRTYNGKDYNNVDQYYPLPDSTTTSDEVLKEFDVEPTVKAEKPATDSILSIEEPQLDIDISDDELPF